MTLRRNRIQPAIVPAAVFLATLSTHYLFLRFFPESAAAQSQWQSDPALPLTLTRYIENGDHWLGMSYGIMLAFTVTAFRAYRQNRMCEGGALALGGITLTGAFATLGCFLLGCCGSPMLAVYLSFFGASFLSLAKPMIFLMTTLSVIAGWLWLRHRARRATLSLRSG
jgi:hypothetical protein